MLIQIILLVVGIGFLLKGADWLVDGSSSVARRFKVPPLVIGLTIVAFGTSMPELIVNVTSALAGSTDVAFGNIIGSNLANILLILGLTAILIPISVKRSTTWKEIPFSMLAVLVLLVFATKPFLDPLGSFNLFRNEGILLLLFFAIFLYYVFDLAKRKETKQLNISIKNLKSWKAGLLIILGLLGLFFGGQLVVKSAVEIATVLGLSEYVIAATIIAIGTSLPELITSIVAARKGNADLAIGNIIGSNIFNIFWILGVTAVIRPIPIPTNATVDIIILAGATALLFAFMFIGKKYKIERWQGGVLLICYTAYILYLLKVF